jgi:hypothetical protein
MTLSVKGRQNSFISWVYKSTTHIYVILDSPIQQYHECWADEGDSIQMKVRT